MILKFNSYFDPLKHEYQGLITVISITGSQIRTVK